MGCGRPGTRPLLPSVPGHLHAPGPRGRSEREGAPRPPRGLPCPVPLHRDTRLHVATARPPPRGSSLLGTLLRATSTGTFGRASVPRRPGAVVQAPGPPGDRRGRGLGRGRLDGDREAENAGTDELEARGTARARGQRRRVRPGGRGRLCWPRCPAREPGAGAWARALPRGLLAGSAAPTTSVRERLRAAGHASARGGSSWAGHLPACEQQVSRATCVGQRSQEQWAEPKLPGGPGALQTGISQEACGGLAGDSVAPECPALRRLFLGEVTPKAEGRSQEACAHHH